MRCTQGKTMWAAILPTLGQKILDLSDEAEKLKNLHKDIESSALQERVLGAPPTSESRVSDSTQSRVDWPHVIETNATRVGALVTILVPQYRYSING
jgi:hypothetical protein